MHGEHGNTENLFADRIENMEEYDPDQGNHIFIRLRTMYERLWNGFLPVKKGGKS